jgi:hypothetical protein
MSMTDNVTVLVPQKADLNEFVEDMFADARELREVLKEQGDRNDIKDRITCLKYLEEIAKTYVILKKAATDDPRAAGATVRKYASAFSKNAIGRGAKNSRRKPAESDESDFGGDGGDDESAAS